MEIKDRLRARKTLQFKVLESIYEVTGGRRNHALNFDELQTMTGQPYEEVRIAVDYLAQSGLISFLGQQNVQLTSAGVDELTRFHDAPEAGTEHFPSFVMNFAGATIGAVQTGSHATAHVKQNIGAKADEVLALIAQLRGSIPELPADRQLTADRGVRMLEKQAKSDTPDADIVESAGEQLKSAFSGFDGALGVVGQVMMRLALMASG